MLAPLASSDNASRFSRRSFLLRGAQSLSALVLAPTLLNGCGSSANVLPLGQAPSISPPFETLARILDGPLLRPGSDSFAEAALPWNLRYADRVPAAVARCATLEDISESLAWAQSNGVPFVVRSGGHSYSAFSTTPGLMIDISQLRSVDYSDDSGQVKLGPGARNVTVYENLRPPSRSLTHGRCQNVGVAGLCLGGGIGFNMRLHGLTCDQLVETDILLADGRTLTLNEAQNSDLFWAVRGAGGGNFGIHTSMTFQTFAVSQVVAFNINFSENLEDLLDTLFQIVLPQAPRELGIKVTVIATRSGGVTTLRLNLLGQLVGGLADLEEILAAAYAISTPSSDSIQEIGYWDAQEQILGDLGAPLRAYERSHYVFEPIPRQGSRTILENLRNWPGLPDGLANWKMFLAGGAVSDVPSDATAYVHRSAIGVSAMEIEWDNDESDAAEQANLAWLDRFHQAMVPFTSSQSYQNFIDINEPDFLRSYYGDNLERLVAVKAKYDPGNVFNYPQSLPVSL